MIGFGVAKFGSLLIATDSGSVQVMAFYTHLFPDSDGHEAHQLMIIH